jgi:hypothetical protein
MQILCYVEEARHKRSHIIEENLREVSRIDESIEIDMCCQGLRRGGHREELLSGQRVPLQ